MYQYMRWSVSLQRLYSIRCIAEARRLSLRLRCDTLTSKLSPIVFVMKHVELIGSCCCIRLLSI
jgi:hypothetical protein